MTWRPPLSRKKEGSGHDYDEMRRPAYINTAQKNMKEQVKKVKRSEKEK